MPRRCVHDVSDSQLSRMKRVGLDPEKLGRYGADSFEEWLKRREGRVRRAEFQNLKYKGLIKGEEE